MRPVFVFLDVDAKGVDSGEFKDKLHNKSFPTVLDVMTKLVKEGYDENECRLLTPNQLVNEINSNGIFENEFCCLVYIN